jgi:hypothetical protein
MTDRKVIEARIAELRGELGRVEGTPTEVYSRIVGYYRSVRNWNAGKRAEYAQRLAYAMPGRAETSAPPDTERESQGEPRVETRLERVETGVERPSGMAVPVEASLRDGVLVFTREACPNCSPVANYVIASGMRAQFVDVDRDEGLALARDLGVLATPTILGLDSEGRESFRAFDLAGLRTSLADGQRAGARAGASAGAGAR